MRSNRIAHRFASFSIVACAALVTWPVNAASTSEPSSDAASAPRRAKSKAKSVVDPSTPRRGLASFYSKHLAGKKTSSGQPYDPKAMTAAHRSLPMGTKVKVVNPKNDKSVVVTVNDRGPVPKNRMIDLSGAAAKELDMTKAGVTKVDTEVVGKSDLPAPNVAKQSANAEAGEKK